MRILLSVALFLLALSGCGKSQPTDTDTTSATADVSASTNKTPKSAISSNEDKAPALKEAFADAFLVGTALNRAHIYGEDQQGIALIKRHFNSITAENISKWEHIHPEPMVY
ncbi:MAG TPA: endo-1,4-beta-xylanase, partial [Gammaproteobacteria bacterium]